MLAAACTAKARRRAKAAPQSLGGASLPRHSAGGGGPPESALPQAPQPSAPRAPNPWLRLSTLPKGNPISVFIFNESRANKPPPTSKESGSQLGNRINCPPCPPGCWRRGALSHFLTRPAEIFSRHNLNFGESFWRGEQRGGGKKKKPTLPLDPF